MVKPAWKDKEVDQVLTAVFGRDRTQAILAGRCMTCDGEAKDFRTPLSMKEYTISGLCQGCQDEVWGASED
jgi:hypothetical protein